MIQIYQCGAGDISGLLVDTERTGGGKIEGYHIEIVVQLQTPSLSLSPSSPSPSILLTLFLHTMFQDSSEYDVAIQPCHQRSADRIVAGALRNGGLYIKLGQGLGSFNQVLPRQYIDILKSLQDKVGVCGCEEKLMPNF